MVANTPNNTHLYVCDGDDSQQCYQYTLLNDSWIEIATLPSTQGTFHRPSCVYSNNHFYVFAGGPDFAYKLDTRNNINNSTFVALSNNVNMSDFGEPQWSMAVVVNNKYIFNAGSFVSNETFRINIQSETAVKESNLPLNIFHGSGVYVSRLKRIYFLGGLTEVESTELQTPRNTIYYANIINGPTFMPSLVPTPIPNIKNNTYPSGNELTSTDSHSPDSIDNESNEVTTWTTMWENGGYIVLGGSFGMPLLLTGIGIIYHGQEKFYGCDKPNYFAIFWAFWNFGDLYSDLIFTMILLFESSNLWYFSMFFVCVPYTVANVVSLYNIRRWQNESISLSKYISKYDWLIITVSCLAGFYTSVELARSKLFYLPMFSMQITQQDYFKIQNLRVLNTVLFELSLINCIQYVLICTYCLIQNFNINFL